MTMQQTNALQEPWEADAADVRWGALPREERMFLWYLRSSRALTRLEHGDAEVPACFRRPQELTREEQEAADEWAALCFHREQGTDERVMRRRLGTVKAGWTRAARAAVAEVEAMMAGVA